MKSKTERNKIRFLLDEEYFQEVHRQLIRIFHEGPEFCYALFGMWLFKLETVLPAVDVEVAPGVRWHANSLTLREALLALGKLGHKIGIIAWEGSQVEGGSWPSHLQLEQWLASKKREAAAAAADDAAAPRMDNVDVYRERYTAQNVLMGTGSSTHQKLAVFRHRRSIEAIVGGFNLNDSYSAKENHGLDQEGWHDTAVVIDGPAAEAVEEEWKRRWAKKAGSSETRHWWARPPRPPSQDVRRWPELVALPPQLPPPLQDPNSSPFAPPGTASITIATTDGEQGETHIRELMRERIREARNYIYLENYALTDINLVEAISGRMVPKPLVADVAVVVLVTHTGNPIYHHDTVWLELQRATFLALSLPRFYNLYLDQAWTRLHSRQARALQNKAQRPHLPHHDLVELVSVDVSAQTFTWKNEDDASQETARFDAIERITASPVMYGPVDARVPRRDTKKPDWAYVHSKLALFDDEVAVIGSANWTWRSMQYDGEIAAFIEDPIAVKGIRRRLFRHWHTWHPPADIDVGEWERLALQSEVLRAGAGLAADTCYVVPLRLEDFAHPQLNKKEQFSLWFMKDWY